MKARSPSRRDFQQILRVAIVEALKNLPVADGTSARRVARALVHEALAVLDCAGAGRDIALEEVRKVLTKHFSMGVVSPFGTTTPTAKA